MRNLYAILRWVARIASVLIVLATVLFILGEGIEIAKLDRRDVILFLFFPAGLILGFIVAWWKELFGGMAALGSAALFYIIHFGFDGVWPRGVWLFVFAAPGVLFFLAGLMKPRRGLPPIRFPDE